MMLKKKIHLERELRIEKEGNIPGQIYETPSSCVEIKKYVKVNVMQLQQFFFYSTTLKSFFPLFFHRRRRQCHVWKSEKISIFISLWETKKIEFLYYFSVHQKFYIWTFKRRHKLQFHLWVNYRHLYRKKEKKKKIVQRVHHLIWMSS